MAQWQLALRRTLFGRPLGMTMMAVRMGLRRRLQRPAPAAAPAPRPARHPIDEAYGIDTGGVVFARDLVTGSASDIYNVGYAGSQPSIVRTVLATIPGLDQASFVDFGCGKGRPLAVASEYPFRRIVGVELSPDLAAIARANAAVLAARHPERTPIEIAQMDALEFEIPRGLTVIFFYNSMFPGLVKKLSARLAEAAAADPGRRILLVYYNPAAAAVFDAEPAFSRYYAARLRCDAAEAGATSWGVPEDSVVIWQAGAASPLPPLPGAGAPVRVSAGGAAGIVVPG